jgi:hypothetical protein
MVQRRLPRAAPARHASLSPVAKGRHESWAANRFGIVIGFEGGHLDGNQAIDARPLGLDIAAAGIIRASAAIIAQIDAQAEARLTERLQLGARNGPRWTSMTSPTSGGQARRVNFSLPLLRTFSVDWRPRWRRGRGHDEEHGHIRSPCKPRRWEASR